MKSEHLILEITGRGVVRYQPLIRSELAEGKPSIDQTAGLSWSSAESLTPSQLCCSGALVAELQYCSVSPSGPRRPGRLTVLWRSGDSWDTRHPRAQRDGRPQGREGRPG